MRRKVMFLPHLILLISLLALLGGCPEGFTPLPDDNDDTTAMKVAIGEIDRTGDTLVVDGQAMDTQGLEVFVDGQPGPAQDLRQVQQSHSPS